jgi:hypothetical protein
MLGCIFWPDTSSGMVLIFCQSVVFPKTSLRRDVSDKCLSS